MPSCELIKCAIFRPFAWRRKNGVSFLKDADVRNFIVYTFLRIPFNSSCFKRKWPYGKSGILRLPDSNGEISPMEKCVATAIFPSPYRYRYFSAWGEIAREFPKNTRRFQRRRSLKRIAFTKTRIKIRRSRCKIIRWVRIRNIPQKTFILIIRIRIFKYHPNFGRQRRGAQG